MGQFLNKEELNDLENTLFQSKNIHEYRKLYNITTVLLYLFIIIFVLNFVNIITLLFNKIIY